MSGLFHIVFGFMFGLLLWKLSNKRWSLGLVFVFAINSYLGPDQRRLWKMAGFFFNTPELVLFGTALHTYLGWTIFAMLWATLWMGLINLLNKYRIKKGPIIKHSYIDFFLATLSGGLVHLWVDTWGNLSQHEGRNYTKGSVDLIVYDFSIIPVYIGVGLTILLLLIVNIIFFKEIPELENKPSKGDKVKHCFKEFFSNKRNLYIPIFVTLALINTLIMVYIQIESGKAPYYEMTEQGVVKPLIHYKQGDGLKATKYENGGLWFSVMAIIICIILVIYTYANNIQISIKNTQISGTLLVMIFYVVLMTIGYILQPYIGNLSEKEADTASLLFGWAIIVFPLLPFLFVKGEYLDKLNTK